MSEHMFPSDGGRGGDDLLAAAILHHLLVRLPQGCRAETLTRDLLGRHCSAPERALVAAALRRLRAAGLIERRSDQVRATTAARTFHSIMVAEPRPRGGR